jgi:hypothetical protein
MTLRDIGPKNHVSVNLDYTLEAGTSISGERFRKMETFFWETFFYEKMLKLGPFMSQMTLTFSK